LPDYRFFGETGAPCHCEEVQRARRKIPAFNKEQNLVSASPTIDPAAPVKGPDIIDHLKSSERLTARELASILAISPKTIYSLRRAQHDSTFQDRGECPLPWTRCG
jgi:hypothetical protein